MAETRYVPDISYRPRGGIGGWRVGAHPSRGIGSLGAFRDEVPFLVHPDARRIDVRATLRDPFETTFVRRSYPRISIDLYALVDLTGSLGYEGRARKWDLVIELCVALADSATRAGDRFGVVGCDIEVRDECFIPASSRRGIGSEIGAKLSAVRCAGHRVDGLESAAERLVGSRKLIFLVSDFLLPFDLLGRVFRSLAQHDVVPIVIGDTSEDVELPEWGLIELDDLETGERNVVFMRPSLKRRWLESERQRRESLWRLARQYGRTPLTIANAFDADRLSRHLMDA